MNIGNILIVIFKLVIIFFGLAGFVSSHQTPEQIHISYGDSHDNMVIMWSSRDHIKWDVHYGISQSTMLMTSQSTMARLPDTHFKAAKYVYRSILQNLTLATPYFYKIVSRTATSLPVESQVYSFKTLPGENDYNTVSRFIVYGDMGVNMSDPTRSAIEELRQTKNIDAIIHVGDFAYNLHSDGGKIGDIFMREIQPLAAVLPYMTCTGNHEIAEDFKSYRTRFSTPNTSWPIPLDKMWYSFDVGLVHFISYSTEVYFTYNERYVCEQYDWLLQDLIAANENRDKRPWIIAFGHRPMYCSNNDADHCTDAFTRLVKPGLEPLFHTQGVDLIVEAHEHSYERLYPLFDDNVERFNYTNPRAPVHVITGAAGSREGINGWKDSPNAWSAYRFKRKPNQQYIQSFGVLEIHNKTHLLFIETDASDNNTMDQFWLVQEHHGGFTGNISCYGADPPDSCFCNMPLVSLKTIIRIFVIIILVMIFLVFVLCVYELLKYRLKKNSNRKNVCALLDVKYKSIRKCCYSGTDRECDAQLLEDFDS